MRKSLLISATTGFMAVFLVTACAEESKDTDLAGQSNTPSTKVASTDNAGNTDDQDSPIMNQPVDFSTPENVEKTLQIIREQEGEKAYNQLKNAMQYIMVYDLSVGNNEDKLYKKLDGRTPEQIIAKMKR